MKFQLMGKNALIENDVFQVNLKDKDEKVAFVDCKCNACADIDWEFVEETKSYHFYNDGDKKVLLKVRSGSIFGCGGYKTKRMRPYGEWDTGFIGICDYEANYR